MIPGAAFGATIVEENRGRVDAGPESGTPMGRIVVIDDEPLILRATQRLLRSLGHRVRTYVDGRVAVELMRRERADVALVDLHMSGMDGIQVLCRLLALDRPPCIIVMSGDGMTPVKQRLAELGLAERVDYLGKPFTVSELEEVLARSIKGRRAN